MMISDECVYASVNTSTDFDSSCETLLYLAVNCMKYAEPYVLLPFVVSG